MKKITAFFLLAIMIFSLTACKKKYEPQESTEEEKQVVMTLSLNGDEYEVKYELYRAFFLSYKSEIDGGDHSVWESDGKQEYIDRINSMIADRVCEIYSAFALCKTIGFDIYSKSVEEEIEESIRIGVEGGVYGGTTVEGYESYEDYLAALKKIYLNYSVQTLLLRYAIALKAIDSYYIGTVSSDDISIDMSVGNLEYTKEDVSSFYFSDECVRVMRASFPKMVSYTPKETAEKLRDKLMAAAESGSSLAGKNEAVFNAIMASGRFSSVKEVEDGFVIGRYNLERSYYGEMTDIAFSLNEGEVSDIINIVTDDEDSYYVLYRTDKSEAHFEECYDEILYIYLSDIVGKKLHGVGDMLKNSVSYTDSYSALDHSNISM